MYPMAMFFFMCLHIHKNHGLAGQKINKNIVQVKDLTLAVVGLLRNDILAVNNLNKTLKPKDKIFLIVNTSEMERLKQIIAPGASKPKKLLAKNIPDGFESQKVAKLFNFYVLKIAKYKMDH